jgi:uncharacterized protein YbaP (TraB family)
MNKLFLAALLAFAPAAAPAQAGSAAPAPRAAAASMPDADPALWVVRDDDTTIFLFGTFHLLDGRPWFNDEVKAAFDTADELVVEAIIPDDLSEIQPLVLRYAVDPQGRKLSDRLTPEQNAVLSEAVSSLGAPAAAFDPLEPWFVSMTLSTVISQRLGISAEHGPEGVLIRAARERGISVSELEGLEWQIRLFDEMPEEQQLAQLRQTLDGLDTLHESMAPMLAAWSAGDAEALHDQLVAHGEEDPDLQRLLFTDRNRTWAEWIRLRMERPGTVFVAVGAGHLAGSDSVQAVLREHDVQTERVPQAEGAAAAAP